MSTGLISVEASGEFTPTQALADQIRYQENKEGKAKKEKGKEKTRTDPFRIECCKTPSRYLEREWIGNGRRHRCCRTGSAQYEPSRMRQCEPRHWGNIVLLRQERSCPRSSQPYDCC